MNDLNKEDAVLLLSFHAGRITEYKGRKWEEGLLPVLKSGTSQLNDNYFIEIMESLKVLYEDFREDKLDRDLMASVYGIFQSANMQWNMQAENIKNGKIKSRKFFKKRLRWRPRDDLNVRPFA